MGREAQPPHSRLTPRLEADLHRINFYRFCQLLEKRNPDKPLIGSTSHPADDPVRFAPHPGMGFPASELKAIEYDEDDDRKPPVIRTTFMGMYGVDSRLAGPTAFRSRYWVWWDWVYPAPPDISPHRCHVFCHCWVYCSSLEKPGKECRHWSVCWHQIPRCR